MCFTISDVIGFRKEKIAKKDIKCYKVLYYSSCNSTAIAPFRETRYFNNDIEKEVTKEALLDIFNGHIYEGLHSYSNKSAIKKAKLDKKRRGYYTCNAIIPKGTKYYYNPFKHQYVSEKLTVYNVNYKIK
jgi:hypothetical protein